jgi:hypothetical protein
MEQREKFNYKIAVFRKALLGFHEALKIEDTVLLTAENYNSLLETIFLINIPGMVESIIRADEEPESECLPLDKVEW